PPAGAARSRGRGRNPAALDPLVPRRRQPRIQRHDRDARPGQQTAAAAVARRRRARRTAALRPHLAVGARLRGWRTAYRPAAAPVALADEATGSGGGGAAPA